MDRTPSAIEQVSDRQAVIETCSLRLQVGRRLRGKWLAAAVLLRRAPTALLFQTGLTTDVLAPSWVVVEDRKTGRVIGRVSAGRAAGAGEQLLVAMRADAQTMTLPEFRNRWSLLHAPARRR